MTSTALRLPLAVLAVAVALVGCGSDSSPEATEPTTPPSVDAATVCPAELPLGDDPDGHGFGTREEADERPSLPTPERAWVCRYDAVDAGESPDGGASFDWVRQGSAEPVAEPAVEELAATLDLVAPFEVADRVCPADLGPRWLVVYPHDGGLVGVVVDDFGCREVRLTDDPATTPPGAGERDGTVPGVLDGGTAVLSAVGVGRDG